MYGEDLAWVSVDSPLGAVRVPQATPNLTASLHTSFASCEITAPPNSPFFSMNRCQKLP